MKIRDISETTSGGIAVVAQPVGKVIKRPNPSVFSKKKKKKTEEGTRCWKGYTKKGTKKMFGKTVPNCVKIK